MAAIRHRPRPGAAVGDRAAPGVGEREAPSVAGAGGEGLGQIARVTRVEWPVTARIAGRVGQAEPRSQRHREIYGPAEAGGRAHGSADAGGRADGPAEAGGRADGPAEAGGRADGPVDAGGRAPGSVDARVHGPARAGEVVRA